MNDDSKTNKTYVCRARSWCYTLNNPTPQELDALPLFVSTYHVYGQETGDSGTDHVQGYVEFETRKTLGKVKKILVRAHWEKRNGTPLQASVYCKKDGDYIETGTLSSPGKRSDLDQIRDEIKNGATKRDLWDDHFPTMVRYHKGMYEGMQQLATDDCDHKFSLDDFEMDELDDFSKSYVLYGEPGIGKTCFALAHFTNPLFVTHMDDLLNFDKNVYDGIVFDDMSFQHMPRTAQIHLVDVDHRRSIHCRYARAILPASTRKIFTTNEAYGAIFLEDSAINRRLHRVEFTKAWIERVED